jgi:hypothetical protein
VSYLVIATQYTNKTTDTLENEANISLTSSPFSHSNTRPCSKHTPDS